MIDAYYYYCYYLWNFYLFFNFFFYSSYLGVLRDGNPLQDYKFLNKVEYE